MKARKTPGPPDVRQAERAVLNAARNLLEVAYLRDHFAARLITALEAESRAKVRRQKRAKNVLANNSK